MGKLPTQTYHEIDEERIDFEFLRNKLKLKQIEAKRAFSEKYPHAINFLLEKGVQLEKIREHSARILGAGAMAGSLLLTPPSGTKALPPPHEIIEKIKAAQAAPITPPQEMLVATLTEHLPEKTRPLSREEEKYLERIFNEVVGVSARATLEGEHLNTTYGLIGAEQHLRLFPGDTIANHKPYLKEGIAPGRGAWGFFAPSKTELTADLEEKERWYAVVQTLYLPDWNKRQPYLKNWYKYRKDLMVNSKNGNAVVAAVADSGPAAWTGKHFGGSPEVMEYLGGPRYKKGPVIVFFVDDPENKIPLGPVEYNKINIAGLPVMEI
ncbi:hypothetical protein A2V56_04545 [Candidatus Woesebacteria bacterium RBG_19FT_COMBO_42_9]|nr:MAG: hypothetical protein A2V56_04545 [Candidatus Woesebacteria bacterium RBG_19FT_COMBO_42_9]